RKPVKFDEKTGLDRLKNRLKTEKPATSAGFRVKFADRTGNPRQKFSLSNLTSSYSKALFFNML
ncbi:MAG: hypothetical protein NTZ47_00825, partial [Bacteroidetes bacterium]|nr:hypothetical protein [Bacteroidota bacterium]